MPFLLAIILTAGIPPLTAGQRGVLDTAIDGPRDHREPAFAALLEHVGAWDGELGDVAIRLEPDLKAMKARPQEFRGDLCRIEGRIDTIEPLLAPSEGVDAWFIRTGRGEPALVYVDFTRDRAAERSRFHVGTRVSIDARFYKRYEHRLDAAGQDGSVRAYAAFVGAYPRPGAPTVEGGGVSPGEGGRNPSFIIVPLVAVLAGGFVMALLLAIRARRGATLRARSEAGRDFGPPPDGLPSDPVEALAALRRRAEGDR